MFYREGSLVTITDGEYAGFHGVVVSEFRTSFGRQFLNVMIQVHRPVKNSYGLYEGISNRVTVRLRASDVKRRVVCL